MKKGLDGAGWWRAAGPLLILLLGLGLRLYLLDAQDIWWDEGRNLDVASRALAQIAGARELDIHPPLYFYLLHGWMGLAGRGEFALRFFSAFFGLLSVPVVGKLGARVGGWRASLLAMLVSAAAPMWVAESQETRMYTLTLFSLGLGLYALIRALEAPAGERRWWLLWGLTSAAALLTHYSALFVLVAENLLVGLWWLGQRRKEDLLGWWGSQVLAALLFLPQLPRALEQVMPYRNPTLQVPSPQVYFGQTWQAFLFGVNVVRDPVVAWGMAAAAVVLLAGTVWGLARLGHGEGYQTWPAGLLWCAFLVPWVLYFVVLRDRSAFHPRYIMFVTPALYALLGAAMGRLWGLHSLLGVGALALWCVPAGVGLGSDYWNPAFFREDTSGVARYVAEQAGPQDVVLIDVPYPFFYYYEGQAPAHYLFVDINTVDRRLMELCAGCERVFYITWYKSDTDPRQAVPYLLEKHGTLQGERDFRGYHLAWYDLPPDVEFHLAGGWRPAEARFADWVGLTGDSSDGADYQDVVGMTAYSYGVSRGTVRSDGLPQGPAGQPIWVAVRWECLAPMQTRLKVSVRLVDGEEHRLAQDDRPLVNDRHLHTDYWEVGQEAINVYLLHLPADTPPGLYYVQALVYDEATLEALALSDGGQSLTLGAVSLGSRRSE